MCFIILNKIPLFRHILTAAHCICKDINIHYCMRADENGNVSGVENPLDIVALIGVIDAANFRNKVEAYINSKNKVNITFFFICMIFDAVSIFFSIDVEGCG